MAYDTFIGSSVSRVSSSSPSSSTPTDTEHPEPPPPPPSRPDRTKSIVSVKSFWIFFLLSFVTLFVPIFIFIILVYETYRGRGGTTSATDTRARFATTCTTSCPYYTFSKILNFRFDRLVNSSDMCYANVLSRFAVERRWVPAACWTATRTRRAPRWPRWRRTRRRRTHRTRRTRSPRPTARRPTQIPGTSTPLKYLFILGYLELSQTGIFNKKIIL